MERERGRERERARLAHSPPSTPNQHPTPHPLKKNITKSILNAFAAPQWLKSAMTFPLIVTAEFSFQDTPRGRRVVRWVEDVSALTLVYCLLPMAERWWPAVVEPLGGTFAAQAGAALDAAAPAVDRLMAKHLGVKTRMSQI